MLQDLNIFKFDLLMKYFITLTIYKNINDNDPYNIIFIMLTIYKNINDNDPNNIIFIMFIVKVPEEIIVI